jgi:hypothetical protein
MFNEDFYLPLYLSLWLKETLDKTDLHKFFCHGGNTEEGEGQQLKLLAVGQLRLVREVVV